MEMESPFFRNRRWYPQPDPIRSTSFHPSSIRGVPVYPVDPIHRPQERSSGPKVVQIPVQFIGSEPVDRTGSVVKIQRVFRGFFVRKCLKKVKDVRVEVDEIEEKLLKSEVVELLRKEEKERVRMNEALMSLLFKLDSICGVDFGVRVCRKAVIRKVIALQERIDAIVASDLEGNCEIADEIGVSVEAENSIKPDLENDDNEAEIIEGNCEINNEVTEIGVSVETENSYKPDHPSDLGDCVECGENLENVCSELGNDEAETIDVGVDWEMKSNVDLEGVKNDNDDKGRNRELLEKMMEESEKMTKLMNELYERNEMQTKMLKALTNRVEMLEKAFVCDRLRKKKKTTKTPTTCKKN